MNHRISLLAASIAALLVAGSALAHGPRHGFGTKLDTDGDGKVQVAEVEARAVKHAAELDANGDGTIEISEMKAWREAQRAKREQARMARLDANGDGAVSVEEFVSAHTERMARRDANQDGVISRDEMRPHRHGKHGRGAVPAAD
jgi:Ca2+-binding EF-hand superfamily protein